MGNGISEVFDFDIERFCGDMECDELEFSVMEHLATDEEPETRARGQMSLSEEKQHIEFIRFYLLAFFSTVDYHLGGPIPAHTILQDRHIQMCLKLELAECIQMYYGAIEAYVGGMVTDAPLRDLLTLQNTCAAIRMPQRYSGGVLLVWLILHKGYDI